jgi:hypothetical protein
VLVLLVLVLLLSPPLLPWLSQSPTTSTFAAYIFASVSHSPLKYVGPTASHAVVATTSSLSIEIDRFSHQPANKRHFRNMGYSASAAVWPQLRT